MVLTIILAIVFIILMIPKKLTGFMNRYVFLRDFFPNMLLLCLFSITNKYLDTLGAGITAIVATLSINSLVDRLHKDKK